jgi:hypothetical protein
VAITPVDSEADFPGARTDLIARVCTDVLRFPIRGLLTPDFFRDLSGITTSRIAHFIIK